MRVKYELRLLVSSTDNDEADLANLATTTTDGDQSEAVGIKIKIAPGAVNVSLIPAGLETAKLTVLRTYTVDPTQDPVLLNFKLNSTSSDAVPVTPLGEQREAHLLLTAPLTALYVSNPGSVAMYVQGYFVG